MGEILHIPGDWLVLKKHPWVYYFVQPRGHFPLGRTYSSRPVTKFHSDFNNPEGKPPARVRAILADCRSEMEGILININRTRKAAQKESMQNVSRSGEKGRTICEADGGK